MAIFDKFNWLLIKMTIFEEKNHNYFKKWQFLKKKIENFQLNKINFLSTILTILPFWQLLRQSWRLATFETLITILTIQSQKADLAIADLTINTFWRKEKIIFFQQFWQFLPFWQLLRQSWRQLQFWQFNFRKLT